MLYCDKCRNHLAQRHIHGCNSDHSFGPFQLDLCPQCYNELRSVIADWTQNTVWTEVDAHAHANEKNLSGLRPSED